MHSYGFSHHKQQRADVMKEEFDFSVHTQSGTQA